VIDISESTITLILSIIGAASGLSGLLISYHQAHLAERAATQEALLPLYERYQSNDMRRVRRQIYGGDYDYKNLTSNQEDEIRLLLADYELLGVLVLEKIVDLKVVKRLYQDSPPSIWRAREHTWIKKVRTTGPLITAPKYACNFQDLMKIYDQ